MEPVSEKFRDIMENREKIERRYDAQARKNLSKPANFCQMCGHEMTPSEDPMIQRWQSRWSIHYACANAVDDRLDRSVGIMSERMER